MENTKYRGKHLLKDVELVNEFSSNIDKFWSDVNSFVEHEDCTDEQRSRMTTLYEMARRYSYLVIRGKK